MTLAQQMELRLDDVITHISPANLLPNPYQPKSRQEVSDEIAAGFGASFERSGLIHFPIVRRFKDTEHYEVGDGWLRRAGYLYNWKQKGLEQYSRLPCIVRDLTDQQMADLALEANLQRRDFNPIELAWLYKKYLEDFEMTQEDFAASRGIGQGEVSNTIRLLELPEDIQRRIISQEISKTHGRELLRLNDYPDKQKKTLDACVKQGWTVGALDKEIASELYRGSRNLNPKAQSWENPPKFDISGCKECAHAEKLSPHSGKKELRCLDIDCWQRKQDESQKEEIEKKKAELAEQGIERLYKVGELGYNEYNFLYDYFLEAHPECNQCAHRAGIMGDYGIGSIVCIDPECYAGKSKAMNEASQQNRERETAAKAKRIEDAVANLTDFKVGLIEVFMMVLDEDYEETAKQLGIEAPTDEAQDDSDEDIFGNICRARLFELDDMEILKMMLKHMLGSWNYNFMMDMSIVERLEASALKEPQEMAPIILSPELEGTLTGSVATEPEPSTAWPDKDEIKARAAADIEAEKARQAREAKFTKSVRCSGCGEKKTMEFQLSEGDESEHHWKAGCPKCQAVNFIKNARWDGMCGLKKEAKEAGV